MHATRNITLCNKDCLCLFVCPTGATDTETGQIDFERCLDGCRLCIDACPSHAIYMTMDNYAAPMRKHPELAASLLAFLDRKYEEEKAAESLSTSSDNPGEKLLAKAVRLSCRIVAEDCAREADYMLPQGAKVKELLEELGENSDPEIVALAKGLLF